MRSISRLKGRVQTMQRDGLRRYVPRPSTLNSLMYSFAAGSAALAARSAVAM